jgi:hypothetical protein
MKKTLAALVLLAAALVGCASEKSAPAPEAAPSPVTKPVAAPAKTEPTRAQAAARYLEIVGPINKYGQTTYKKKCGKAHDYLTGKTNETFQSDGEIMSDIVACYRDLDKLGRTMVRELETATWPAEARGDIAEAISFEQAQLYAGEQIIKADSMSELFQAYNNWPADNGASDRVRARLGLPYYKTTNQ